MSWSVEVLYIEKKIKQTKKRVLLKLLSNKQTLFFSTTQLPWGDREDPAGRLPAHIAGHPEGEGSDHRYTGVRVQN